MPSRSSASIVGWVLSIVIYIGIVITVSFMLTSQNQKIMRYTAKKKNLLNVTLVERKEKKKISKKRKIVKKKTTVQKVKTAISQKKIVRAEKKKIIKPNFKNLFKNINLNELPEESQKKEKKIRKKIVEKDIQEVEKMQKAKKAVESLDYAKSERRESDSTAIYDEFRGKISDILRDEWQYTVETVSGTKANVTINIDKFGNFSYKIEELSYNDAFNAKLRNFLEGMRDRVFPASSGTKAFSMLYTFKDEME